MSRRGNDSPLVSRFRPVIQLLGLVRKELVEVGRQPRLLAVLVLGPFLVLLLFAAGYDQESTVLRTAFVGPEDSVYTEAVERFGEELGAYVETRGYSSDLLEANNRLERGEIDLIVVFPPAPAESVGAGERAVITVLHDKLDPIQQTAVEVSAEVAVQELNAIVIEQIFAETQAGLQSYDESIGQARADLDALEAADQAGDEAEVARLSDQLSTTSRGLETVVATSAAVDSRLGGELGNESQGRYDDARSASADLSGATGRLANSPDGVDPADLDDARVALDDLEAQGSDAGALDPAVVARPFVSDTENLLREPVGVTDYFAPAAVALLVQHMVLTFAALGLVADRSLGLFEILRVGPIGAGRVLLGRYVAYTVIGGSVAALLLGLISLGIDVPFRGSVAWVAVGTLGLLIASIGFGLVLSLLARSETQAVQFAMLALLSALFFGDFFLSIDAFRWPINLISWLLPVTYGIRLMRDVMLRGATPATADLLGLVATSVVFALAAWFLLARKLRKV